MKFLFRKFVVTGIAAAAALALALPAQSAEVLKVSTALGTKHDQSTVFFDTFMKKMKEDESLVKLNYIGGPEVTPNRKQGPAMKRGLIDIIMSPVIMPTWFPRRGCTESRTYRAQPGGKTAPSISCQKPGLAS